MFLLFTTEAAEDAEIILRDTLHEIRNTNFSRGLTRDLHGFFEIERRGIKKGEESKEASLGRSIKRFTPQTFLQACGAEPANFFLL